VSRCRTCNGGWAEYGSGRWKEAESLSNDRGVHEVGFLLLVEDLAEMMHKLRIELVQRQIKRSEGFSTGKSLQQVKTVNARGLATNDDVKIGSCSEIAMQSPDQRLYAELIIRNRKGRFFEFAGRGMKSDNVRLLTNVDANKQRFSHSAHPELMVKENERFLGADADILADKNSSHADSRE